MTDPTKPKIDSQQEDFFDWPLAELQEVEPSLLVDRHKRDDLDNLFLALALVFNDLKTVVMVRWWLNTRPPPEDITPFRGQHYGLASHMDRYGAAILHELLKLIDDSKKIIEDPRFVKIRRCMPRGCREAWDNLREYATGATPGKKALMLIRNNAVFHYDQPRALANAYREFFFNDTKNAANTKAYMSLGASMEKTRFYFADAAAQRAIPYLADQLAEPDINALITTLMRDANDALAGLVAMFYRYKVDQLAKVRGAAQPHSKPKRTTNSRRTKRQKTGRKRRPRRRR